MRLASGLEGGDQVHVLLRQSAGAVLGDGWGGAWRRLGRCLAKAGVGEAVFGGWGGAWWVGWCLVKWTIFGSFHSSKIAGGKSFEMDHFWLVSQLKSYTILNCEINHLLARFTTIYYLKTNF